MRSARSAIAEQEGRAVPERERRLAVTVQMEAVRHSPARGVRPIRLEVRDTRDSGWRVCRPDGGCAPPSATCRSATEPGLHQIGKAVDRQHEVAAGSTARRKDWTPSVTSKRRFAARMPPPAPRRSSRARCRARAPSARAARRRRRRGRCRSRDRARRSPDRAALSRSSHADDLRGGGLQHARVAERVGGDARLPGDSGGRAVELARGSPRARPLRRERPRRDPPRTHRRTPAAARDPRAAPGRCGASAGCRAACELLDAICSGERRPARAAPARPRRRCGRPVKISGRLAHSSRHRGQTNGDVGAVDAAPGVFVGFAAAQEMQFAPALAQAPARSSRPAGWFRGSGRRTPDRSR